MGREESAMGRFDGKVVFITGATRDPQDVTNAALFLASDEARFLTGVQLPVDVGFTMP